MEKMVTSLTSKDTENGLDLIKQEVFHFTGLMSMVGTFENGFREGIWTYWYEDGQKRLEDSSNLSRCSKR